MMIMLDKREVFCYNSKKKHVFDKSNTALAAVYDKQSIIYRQIFFGETCTYRAVKALTESVMIKKEDF